MNFYERYSGYSDSQIMEILKNKLNYQEEAVDAAVKIAIERGLIHSEQDLLSAEYRNSDKQKFSFFPPVSNDYHRQRLIASMFRFLYVLVLIPLIYGVLSYAKGQQPQMVIGLLIGIIGLAVVRFYSKTRQKIYWYVLFAELILVAVMSGMRLFSQEVFVWQDIAVYLVATLLPAYILLYVRKLVRQ